LIFLVICGYWWLFVVIGGYLFVLKNQENVDNDFEKEHCGSIFEIE
jgi:hypothetical protein